MLAFLLFWKGILPAWRVLNTDFPNYYLVARLLREGYSLDRIYDWIWLQRIKDHWGLDQSLVGFAGLTPFSSLPIVPLSIYSALTAKRIWIVVNLLFLGTSAELLHRSTSLGRLRIWVLCLLAIIPLQTSFLYGQMHLIVLLLLVMAYFFHRRDNEIACGVCIALAGALKMYPLVFGVYFLWKKQWRAAFATTCATALIVAISYLWMGGSILHIYATQILPRSLQGEVLDPYNVHNASAAAFLHRLFLYEPALNPAPTIYSPSLYAIAYPLWQLAVFFPLFALLRPSPVGPDREKLEWAAFLFALLLASPVPSTYHFVVMILSIVLLVDVLLRRRDYRLAVTAISLYALMSAVDLWAIRQHLSPAIVTFLGFGRLWLGILLFALFLFTLAKKCAPSDIAKTDRRRILLLCAVSAVVWVSSVVGYHRHLAHFKQEMSRRVLPPASTYLAINPQPRSDGYLFIGMAPDGYRVLDRQGLQVDPQGKAQASPDELSFAVAEDHSVLLEVADATGSRIVTVPNEVPTTQSQDILHARVLIQDAESPAISADSQSIAFIRERKGKGTLWITRLEGTGTTPPTQVVGDAYDVRNVSFQRSGELLFTAKTAITHDRLRIFLTTPGKRPHLLSMPHGNIASFALSLDERLLAFTRLEHNRWQLGYVDLATRRETMLTSGDCNAYTPGWTGPRTIAYATDCDRGLGLTALASIHLDDADAPAK
ncbi:MAG: hypothetical protein JWQ42_1735 [Edaphobacter sp.]|nr:hypothetical protein [Edaphobacter sp.]